MSVNRAFFKQEVIDYCKNGGFDSREALYQCVAKGDLEELEQIMERYIALLRPLFWSDPELPKETMRFVFPQLQLIAAQGGMSLVHCLGIQEAYYYALEHAETAEDVIQVLKNQCRELTEIISEMKAEKVFSEVTRRCRDYIRNHLYEDLSIPALAEALAFSESYLSHRFREKTGKSIRTFIREERVAEAKLLMRANFPNAQIASLLGFASQSHFTDIFKRETGMTPTQFRKTVV